MNIDRLSLAFLLTACHGLTYGICLPQNDDTNGCRYEAGDSWCAEHGNGNVYAYSDSCLKKRVDSAKSNTADVSGLNGLRQGMNYSEAREIILSSGWQGNNMRWQDVPEYGQAEDVYVNNGWHEVAGCAGTGTAPCRFEYKDIHSNTLIVITEGECLNEQFEPVGEGEKCDLDVSRWFLE